LQRKDKSLGNDIVFGTRTLLKKISFLNNNKKENKDAIETAKKEFTENRLYPFYLLGEANQHGNRFFDFDLENKKIIYKPERGTKVEICFSNYRTYKKTLMRLQEMIDAKGISVSVMMDKNSINLSFDDEQLYGFAVDEKARREAVKKIKQQHLDEEIQTSLIKEQYKFFYDEQKSRKLKGKLAYRHLAVDMNPDYIGCVILDLIDGKVTTVAAFYYDLVKTNMKLFKTAPAEHRKHINNKRIHGISHVWKDLFKIFTYFNCGHLVIEELEIKNNDLGSKEANRKVNNMWHRELTSQLVNKYCNKLGIDKIEINPVYSSLIGNTIYNFFIDPVNAAIEIGRRGILKFTKGNFYPTIDIGTITNTMTLLNKQGDVSFLKDCESWREIYNKTKESELRYRTTIKETKIPYVVVLNVFHSGVKKIVFSSENFSSLHVNL